MAPGRHVLRRRAFAQASLAQQRRNLRMGTCALRSEVVMGSEIRRAFAQSNYLRSEALS